MAMLGSGRQNMADPEVQMISEKIRRVRVSWWKVISSLFDPLEQADLLAPPDEEARKYFDDLLYQAFNLLGQKDVRGRYAVARLEAAALPIRLLRLQKNLESGGLEENQKASAERRLNSTIRMMKERKIGSPRVA